MRQEFEEYCEELDLSMTLIERATEIEAFYSALCPEEVEEICVSQVFNSEDEVVAHGLWFFSDNYIMEAKNFRKEDRYDIYSVTNGIRYIQTTMEEYDFEEAGEESRLSVEAYATDSTLGFTIKLTAIGSNCDHLRDIVMDYLRDNLV